MTGNYYENHRFCPICGNNKLEYTCVGYLDIDRNRATCICGWRGIVDNLIDHKITLKEKINKFKELKQNWDGYHAEPISEKVILKALDVVDKLEKEGYDSVYPTGRNSIQFEKEFEGTYFEIEIFEDRTETFVKE